MVTSTARTDQRLKLKIHDVAFRHPVGLILNLETEFVSDEWRDRAVH